MKILIISQYFWPENFRINDLAEELSGRDHEVTILTGIPNYPNGKFFRGYSFFSFGVQYFKKIKIIRIPLIPRFSGKGWQLVLNYTSFLIVSLFAPIILSRNKFDVIFVYEPSPFTVGVSAVLMKKVKKIPILFWVQDLWPESLEAAGLIKTKYIIKPISTMVAWIYKNCDLVLVQSKGFVKYVNKSGAEKSKIIYLPNWAENFYRPNMNNYQIRSELPVEGFNVMFAGNIGVSQSIDTIIKAADRLREYNINWIIIGNGRQKAYLIKEVNRRKLKERFCFIDQKPAEKMPYYFNYAHVLLVTLLSKPIFNSTIPGKIQSYLACGKPIVASLDGEGSNIINESNSGIAVSAENDIDLSSAILRLSKMKDSELSQLGANAIEYYKKNFNREKLISKIEKLMVKYNN